MAVETAGNPTCIFISGLWHTAVMCVTKKSLSLSLTASFSLPVFSILGRQMGASAIRKGSLITVKLGYIVRDMSGGGGEWGDWGTAGVCQICCVFLWLIWREAQEMIKAQVKSPIELLFRLIVFLPPDKELSTLYQLSERVVGITPSTANWTAGQYVFGINTYQHTISCF